jgi:hypothetical protein
MESQRAFLGNPQTRGPYFKYIRQKTLRTIGLRISPEIARSSVSTRITLPDLQTWATADNIQTRESLGNEIVRTFRELAHQNAISVLRSPGVSLEVLPRLSLQYDLKATVYY